MAKPQGKKTAAKGNQIDRNRDWWKHLNQPHQNENVSVWALWLDSPPLTNSGKSIRRNSRGINKNLLTEKSWLDCKGHHVFEDSPSNHGVNQQKLYIYSKSWAAICLCWNVSFWGDRWIQVMWAEEQEKHENVHWPSPHACISLGFVLAAMTLRTGYSMSGTVAQTESLQLLPWSCWKCMLQFDISLWNYTLMSKMIITSGFRQLRRIS